jgi:hypothetical protein
MRALSLWGETISETLVDSVIKFAAILPEGSQTRCTMA